MDEIGEMKPALQAKLLHVLQDAEFTKLGSNKRINVDVRIVAATNRDLEKMMLSGEFREDLYYRLKVIELTVPALRERLDEIPTLTDFFTARYSKKYNRPLKPVSEQLRQMFLQYEWPGNIRELENMIKRVVILQDEHLVIREIEHNMQRVAAMSVADRRCACVRGGRACPGSAAARSAIHRRRRRTRVAGCRRGPRTRCRRDWWLTGLGGESGVDQGRTRRDRADVATGPLEPPQGCTDSRRELQDAAQQDQGVRHQPRLTRLIGYLFSTSRHRAFTFNTHCATRARSQRDS